jgi:hypothetical protein
MYTSNVLVGNVVQLARRADKFFPNLVGKLDNGDEVTDAEPEAHIALLFSL